jgi:hypothetical protein
MQYPLINRHYQTVELLSTAFSPSHELVAFAVDLKNNEKSSYLIAKTTGKRELVRIGDSHRTSKLEDAHDLLFTSENTIFYVKS